MKIDTPPRSRSDVEDWLRNIHQHYRRSNVNDVLNTLDRLMNEAVQKNDEQTANELWALQTAAHAQRHYLAAYDACREGRFYFGWCEFEKSEIRCSQFLKNFPLWRRRFWIGFIQRQIDWLQKLFPYRIFASIGIKVIDRRCSICGQQLSLRTRCQHVMGQPYIGKMCCHVIRKWELLEISMVEDPVYKYAVSFLSTKSGEMVDRFNYSLIDYVVRGLRSPFVGFRFENTTRLVGADERRSLLSSDPCPCLSRKKFGECCSGKAQILAPHCQVEFEQSPPADFQMFSFPVIVHGRDRIEDLPFDEKHSPEGDEEGRYIRATLLKAGKQLGDTELANQKFGF